MPDQIDLGPESYRTKSDQRVYTAALLVAFGGVLLGLYVAGMLLDWRGWGIAFFGAMTMLGLVNRFPKFFNKRMND